jgi:hypothetical protein
VDNLLAHYSTAGLEFPPRAMVMAMAAASRTTWANPGQLLMPMIRITAARSQATRRMQHVRIGEQPRQYLRPPKARGQRFRLPKQIWFLGWRYEVKQDGVKLPCRYRVADRSELQTVENVWIKEVSCKRIAFECVRYRSAWLKNKDEVVLD